MKERKIPLRKCLGCNELKEKKELIRVVKNKDNEISIDFVGKANGRGAYICKNIKCFETAYKRKSIERALQHPISKDLYEALRKELENAE